MISDNDRSARVTRLSLTMGWHALIGAMGLLITVPAMARAESAQFDIAAQPMPAALKAFAAQARMQLLYEHGAVASASGNAVTGELDKQAALERLLRNTGLEVIYSSENAATIRPTGGDKQATQEQKTAEVRGLDRLRLAQVGQTPLRRDSSDDVGKTLEEIIVTARRREENVQTVPMAITVLSQQTLQDNSVQTIQDLQHLVPSLSTFGGLTRDTLNVGIRGHGTGSTAGSATVPLPGVVTYINEVPVPTNFNGVVAVGAGLFFDLENVQVLKGPQGTLFGRNSTGGALLLQTARPTNEFGGRIQLGYGNYNNREIDGAINIPIVDDTLLARVAFSGGVRDGFTRLLGSPAYPNGIDADDRDYWAARGTVTFRPTDWFQNDTILTYSEHETHGNPSILTDVNPNGLVPRLFPGFATSVAQQQALGTRTAIPVSNGLVSNGSNLSVNNISSFALTDDLTFRNIFGFDELHTGYAGDFDATALPVLDTPGSLAHPMDMHVRQFTEEAQFLGTSFGGRLDWIVGAFYLYIPPPGGFVTQTQVTFGTRNDRDWRPSEKSTAGFAQGTYDLSAMITGLKFTAGARYTWDDRSFSGRGGQFGSVCLEPRLNCDAVTNVETKASKLTWTVGLDYQATPATLVYVTSRRGYRAGGSNGPALPEYDPEYVDDVELGVKSDWNAGSVPIRTNAAVYYQNYRDIQVLQTFLNPQTGGVNNIAANAAAARVWGGEIEAIAQLTNDLQLGVNFNYLDFEYREFGPGVNAAQLLATHTAGRPPRKYGVNARYQLPLGPRAGDISVRAYWNWQDRTTFTFADNNNFLQPVREIPAFGLLNLTVNWDGIGGRPLDASLFASNLTDEVYTTQASSLYNGLGFVIQRFGEPRMYGIRLRYRFGSE